MWLITIILLVSAIIAALLVCYAAVVIPKRQSIDTVGEENYYADKPLRKATGVVEVPSLGIKLLTDIKDIKPEIKID